MHVFFSDYVLPDLIFMCIVVCIQSRIIILVCLLYHQSFIISLVIGGIVALFSVLSFVKPLSAFNPVVLTSRNVDLISGEISMTEFLIPFIVSVVLSVVFLAAAIRAFNKKQL